ncbi:MAG: VOC family protein [Clostridiales bacterium]|nr:VOC family protein [Clostridiales bacterium]
MKVRSLNHVGLTVGNFEKAVKWYYEMFGFRLVSEQFLEKEQTEKLYDLYQLHDTRIRLGFLRVPGGGVVEIFEFSPVLPSEKVCWNKPGPTHFTIDVKDVAGWYGTLGKKGVEFLSEPQSTDGADWVFMKDPDGNLIELIDLKANYFALKFLGSLVGKLMAGKKYKKYYE